MTNDFAVSEATNDAARLVVSYGISSRLSGIVGRSGRGNISYVFQEGRTEENIIKFQYCFVGAKNGRLAFLGFWIRFYTFPRLWLFVL
jgi:hypothetical protein